MTGKTVAQLVQEARRSIENLTPDQVAAELAAGGVTLVDVREGMELAGGVIPGAIHAPRGMLEFHADPACPLHIDGLDPQRRTILYCALGGRSALGVMALRALGYVNVAHLDGGFKAWEAAGKPVQR